MSRVSKQNAWIQRTYMNRPGHIKGISCIMHRMKGGLV